MNKGVKWKLLVKDIILLIENMNRKLWQKSNIQIRRGQCSRRANKQSDWKIAQRQRNIKWKSNFTNFVYL